MDTVRRKLVLGLGVTGAAALWMPAVIGRAQAQSSVRLTLAHNSPESSPKGLGAKKFAELVKAKTEGRVTVNVAPSEQLGNENSNMAGLRTSTLDFGALGQGALLSIVPEVAAIGLPFLFSTLQTAWAAMDGPAGQELVAKIEEKGLVHLGWWCNGIRQTTNSKRAITTPEDLRHLKIRTPLDPTTVEMFSAMGANPQQISYGEVYLALQSGVVDGQENPLANIKAAKFYEVQKFLSLTKHKYEVTTLLASKTAMARVPEADRELVRQAATEARDYQRQTMAEQEEQLAKEFGSMEGITVNDVDTAPFVKATEVVWDEWEKKPFGDFVKKLRAARA
ncbi:TRAP transporter substrate-binding protein [Mangrovicella endophytica]|uniref:TRAP transporter substrate-binding protein n=1 Tax=Mangrovicella endophytica TaxID=2066697 RepID=UPI000C9E6021|nr:TRAP transporter substrate-binding protein [Mangrovicella endophytica]